MRSKKIVCLPLLLLVLSACGSGPVATEQLDAPASLPADTELSTETPVPPTFTLEPTSTFTPVPTPTLSFEIPAPKDGKGTIAGLVLWNKEPVANASVKLCAEFGGFGGCEGTQYSVNAGKDGYYVFNNVDPGGYVILINISSEIIVYLTDGAAPHKDYVEAGQTLIVEPRYIYRDNLEVTSPAMDEKVSAQPTLKWNAYPGAAYYELTVNSLYIDFSTGPVRVETNEYTIEQPLAECAYFWGVEAFNQEGQKIGETPNTEFASNMSMSFDVDNPGFSCHLTLISPKENAEVSGAAGVEFSWEPNPLATCYRIILWSDEGVYVLGEYGKPLKLDGTQTTYKVDTLAKGFYTWAVEACDEADNTMAISTYINLIVRK